MWKVFRPNEELEVNVEERLQLTAAERRTESDSWSKEIIIAMECFNTLLLKLREVHEREVEGWQVKTQELSNKKGCDTKRMEELFTKNQQMKEQQRLLTENIKTLENRLRAGLCDRCTVTQEVAKRRQQEFEASQIQSLQHMSLLAAEMNILKKENKRLKDELSNLRTQLEGHSDHSSTSTEVKPNKSPDLSPGPMPLITNQESYKPLNTLASMCWKADPTVSRVGERRAKSTEGLDQQSSITPPAPHLKNSSSSTGGEMNPIRHVLHAPVPCRPQPIKSSTVTLPWPLSESSDWISAAAAAPKTSLVQPSPRPNPLRFPNLIQTNQHGNTQRQGLGSFWRKQSPPKPPPTEPTVLFKLKSLSEQVGYQTKPQKKEILIPKADKSSGEGLREVYEGPLDLSERGKPKSSQSPRNYSPLILHGLVRNSPDKDVKTTDEPISSPHHTILPSSSSAAPVKQHEEEHASDHNHKVIKEQEQKEEVNGKTDGKKVPILTISLRPVVVLESLNSALQKQESLSSNGKSSSPAVETGSSGDEQEDEESVSGQESYQGCKRKRASEETETDRDSGTENRKIKIKVRTEEKSPS
ncbi:RBBP8 N-terminal-like protein [Collichthys lucidus]|uniref:RBBP8 N-terminal-like protein n=1 Tax=Collichthys lucidus TaxID=240159 RepID=A0A4U5UTD5_COLLU|nr:RBBP8 N-terminal-like protein [Collichthys lucidus]